VGFEPLEHQSIISVNYWNTIE